MNKTRALIVSVTLATTSSVWSQGTVYLNNYDSGFGIFEPDGKTAAFAGTYFEVLGGLDGNSLTPIASSQPGSRTIFQIQEGDVNGNGPGTGSFFDEGYGSVAGIIPGDNGAFDVLVWRGAATYQEAAASPNGMVGHSPIWTQPTGTPGIVVRPPIPTILALPGPIILVPELPPIVLGIVGAGLLLLRSRGATDPGGDPRRLFVDVPGDRIERHQRRSHRRQLCDQHGSVGNPVAEIRSQHEHLDLKLQ